MHPTDLSLELCCIFVRTSNIPTDADRVVPAFTLRDPTRNDVFKPRTRSAKSAMRDSAGDDEEEEEAAPKDKYKKEAPAKDRSSSSPPVAFARKEHEDLPAVEAKSAVERQPPSDAADLGQWIVKSQRLSTELTDCLDLCPLGQTGPHVVFGFVDRCLFAVEPFVAWAPDKVVVLNSITIEEGAAAENKRRKDELMKHRDERRARAAVCSRR
jgi:hypothetical protein